MSVLQIPVEPFHRALQRIDLVLTLGEAVALVWVVMSFDDDDLALQLEKRYRLLRLFAAIANIIGAL